MPDLSVEKNATQFFIARLIGHIKELQRRKYPGDLDGPQRWLSLCSALAETALEYLAKSEAAGMSVPEQKALLRDANELARQVYVSLSEMDGASLEELPYPVVLPMQRWVNDLRLSNVTFFRALSRANYEVKRFPLSSYSGIRNPSQSLQNALSNPTEWPFLRVTVPARALSLLPHFAIVAHEIGHIVYDNVAPSLSPNAAATQRYVNAVTAVTGQANISVDGRLLIQSAYNSWITELFADAVGLRLLGPAFFFALCSFIESLGPAYALTETHPPTVLRRKIAFERLRRGPQFDFSSVFKKHTGSELSEDINSSLLDPPTAPATMISLLTGQRWKQESAAILVYLPELVETLADKIYDAVDAHVRTVNPTLLYSSTQYDSDLTDHLEPLTFAVPPIETGSVGQMKPTEFSTILNVGWAVLLTRLDKLAVRQSTSNLVAADKAEKLHALLIKAVELSEARRLWESA